MAQYKGTREELGALMIGEAIGTAANVAVKWYLTKYIIFPILIAGVLVVYWLFGEKAAAIVFAAIPVICVLWIAWICVSSAPRFSFCLAGSLAMYFFTPYGSWGVAAFLVIAGIGLLFLQACVIEKSDLPTPVDPNPGSRAGKEAITAHRPTVSSAPMAKGVSHMANPNAAVQRLYDVHGNESDFNVFIAQTHEDDKLDNFLATNPTDQEMEEFYRQTIRTVDPAKQLSATELGGQAKLRELFESLGMENDFETFIHANGLARVLALDGDLTVPEYLDFFRKVIAEEKKCNTDSSSAASALKRADDTPIDDETSAKIQEHVLAATETMMPIYEEVLDKSYARRDQLVLQFFEARGMANDFHIFQDRMNGPKDTDFASRLEYAGKMDKHFKAFVDSNPGEQEYLEFFRKIIGHR